MPASPKRGAKTLGKFSRAHDYKVLSIGQWRADRDDRKIKRKTKSKLLPAMRSGGLDGSGGAAR
jgi:hypothetical protein